MRGFNTILVEFMETEDMVCIYKDTFTFQSLHSSSRDNMLLRFSVDTGEIQSAI